MSVDPLQTPISQQVWDTKYRARAADRLIERSIEDSWWRVARALAAVEAQHADTWAGRFYRQLEGFKFLPGGRILAGAGTRRRVTLFNCFVMGRIEDSLDGIFDALKEGAITMQQGGGVGYDFSTLRPRGTIARSVGGIASGPVSFMEIWDSMCNTLLSTGTRRGAMMATLRCDHPDIGLFIDAKRKREVLRHFNLSVLISDDFMQAVEADEDWPLIFPSAGLDRAGEGPGPVVHRRWSGEDAPVACRVLEVVRARDLWARIMRATYEYAEPGVLFVDRINRLNNLNYCEHISATNPCGEIPLPPYGACDLGSINLTRFVGDPFTGNARLDMDGVEETARVAVRMLDNVIDLSRFPLSAQRRWVQESRRIGLGITGLADALIMLGLRYDELAAQRLAESVMARITHAAYRTSVALGREKGPFPLFDREAYLQAPFIRGLPGDIRDGIRRSGLRNSHLTAIAPAGTISLLAGNISSGIEPVFSFQHKRRLLDSSGAFLEQDISDYAAALWREGYGEQPLPAYFADARSLSPEAHLAMQASLQQYVDSAISKTINIPADYPFEAFKSLYEKAYRLGLKGCTTFRPNPVTGAVLSPREFADRGAHCCSLDREGD
jgi:ribonucleoside-diphosphate reductase alpha chain